MNTTLKAAVIALGAIVASPAPAQDTISATHVFPASLIYSRSFLEFVKKANAAGKGVFTIQVRGGPEAIGMMEQPGAVRSGVVDMVYSPCAFYAAVVPECDAVSASSIDGPTARKNGGTALMNQIHQKRMGTIFLGWVDSGIRFNLWSTKAPKFEPGGRIDITGFKVRGNPIYNAFLTNYLGAQVINLNSSELYTALERGTVDITAWTQIGLMDLNWDRYIKYRILPEFFSTDLIVLVNQKKWDSLSPKSREILQRVAIEHEISSLRDLQALWKKEQAELEKRGIKTLSQGPEASKKFVAGARTASLQRMKERMEKSGGMENYDKVVKLFTPGLMKYVVKVYDAILYGMAYLAGLLMVAMMAIIFIDVLLRNLGYQSSAHFFTFTEYGLLAIPCLGAPWLVREKGHVYVEMLLMQLGPRARQVLTMALAVVCVAVCAVLAWYGLGVTISDFVRSEKDVRSFDMPRWMVSGFIPLSFAMMAAEFARFLARGESFLAPVGSTDEP